MMLGVSPSSIRKIDISWNTGLVPSWVIALHHSMPLVYCLILHSFRLSMTEAFLATRIEAIVSQYFVHLRSCRSTSWDSHAVEVRSDILRVGFCCLCIWLIFFHFSKSRDIDTALSWGSNLWYFWCKTLSGKFRSLWRGCYLFRVNLRTCRRVRTYSEHQGRRRRTERLRMGKNIIMLFLPILSLSVLLLLTWCYLV